MHILTVSIVVAALALLLVVVPVILLQLALQLFTSGSAGDTSLMCDPRDADLGLETPSRPLALSRASS
jgi:hypothetical protein